MRNKKRNIHKPVQHAQKYIYTFPQDTIKASVDSAAHGMTKALEEYKTRPDISKEAIEQEIIQSCKQLEKVPHFTNNHASYLQIAKQWYTYGYMTMQSMYQKDAEGYKKERRQFEEWGYDKCINLRVKR